jgi:hypothetical protein
VAQTKRKWSGDWHSLAARFPMLDEDDLRGMAVSIAEHGQFVPCRMDAAGLGLDGRNRVAACALAEVEPSWEVYDGDSIAFIVEINGDRRHWTTGQRAMATAIGLVDEGLRENGRFKRGSVPATSRTRSSEDNWPKQIARAGLVLDHAPHLADEVLHDRMALDAAYKEADRVRKQKDRVAALEGDEEIDGHELVALYEADVITLDEAEHRADDARKLKKLPDDLAERVRAGALSIDEAVTVERQEREAATRNLADVLSKAAFPVDDERIGRYAGYLDHGLAISLGAAITSERVRLAAAWLEALAERLEEQ